ncbi:hypothetical protein EMQ25_04280 [Arsenicitalea aurantiaca]|uniref:Copper resistance protein D domain-containing protein n=1 Tax=Arsenicitalea aurantiaca TaxID=1783274 RepID=A0A433XM62_9HYPH|nr:hypothetical protein [Arsenicitalea aurantiaca]RUT35169.1 hypothetical protein EMQ25_04280 [Arsenicitalea aurantiaca]
MDIVINLLIWAHLIALVAGGSNSVVMPMIGARLPSAPAETRAALFAMGLAMAQVGKIAMGVLLVTGPLALWLKYGGFGGMNAWFWVKMALIVVMLVSIVSGGIAFKRASGGEMAALERAELFGKVTLVAALGVVLAAIFAFG